MAVLVRTKATPCWRANNLKLTASLRRVMEMQIFLAELLESLQFDLPKEKADIQRAVAGGTMFPAIRGKADQGGAMPIRISLAQ